MFYYEIKQADLRQRADVLIQRQVPQLSRSYIKKLAMEGKLSFKSKPIAAGYKLKSLGDLKLDYDLKVLDDIPYLKLDILFEDEDLMVINKPSGVIVHARGKYWDEASIASSLRQHCSWSNINQPGDLADLRRGIVHRLDRGTSGVMICAKNYEALKALQVQFHDRQVEKTYLGIVRANENLPDRGLIDRPIGRDPNNPKKFKVSRKGKEAQTLFEVKARYSQHYYLEIKPLTGRTHQIRVHLSSLGVPVFGDLLYKGVLASRLMLHAYEISFKHPRTEEVLKFTAPEPKIFKEFLTDEE